MRIGEVLRAKAGLSDEQIERALEVQRSSDKRLGSVLIEMGLVDPDLVAEALAELMHVPPAKRAHFQHIDPEVLALVPAKLARQFGAVPLGVSTKLGKILVVAMRDPTSASDVETLQFAVGMDIRPAAASSFFIDQSIAQFYPSNQPASGDGPGDGELQLQEVSRRGAGASGSAAPGMPSGINHIVPAQAPSLPPPPASIPEARIHGSATLQIAGLVFAVLGFFAGSWVVKKGCSHGPATKSVEGTYRAGHVGVEVDFPEGWKYLSGKNETQQRQGMSARMSLFYRGGTAQVPDDALIVGYLDTNGRLPSLSDAKFLEMVKVSARNMKAPGFASYSMTVGKCKMTDLREEQAGECSGTAKYQGATWGMLVVMWTGDKGRVYIAATLGKGPLSDTRDWMGTMISSVTPIR